MVYMHKTKNGDEMLIMEMGDEHLTNMIKMLARQGYMWRIRGENRSESDVSEWNKLVGGMGKYSVEYCADQYMKCWEMLTRYVCEAALRGLDISRVLQVMADRDKGLNSVNLITEETKVFEEVDF